MKTIVQLGTVSHATMNHEHLIPRFVEALSDLNEARSLAWRDYFADELAAVAAFSELDNKLAEIEQRIAQDGYYDTEDAQYDLEDMFDRMDEFSPPYCYFGAHPGDGSDYGFWPSIDSIEDACRDDEILQVSDTSAVPDDYTGEVWHVTDHGNGTLYSAVNGVLTEVWSIV